MRTINRSLLGGEWFTGEKDHTIEIVGYFKYMRPAELLTPEKPRVFLRRFMPTALSPKLHLQFEVLERKQLARKAMLASPLTRWWWRLAMKSPVFYHRFTSLVLWITLFVVLWLQLYETYTREFQMLKKLVSRTYAQEVFVFETPRWEGVEENDQLIRIAERSQLENLGRQILLFNFDDNVSKTFVDERVVDPEGRFSIYTLAKEFYGL